MEVYSGHKGAMFQTQYGFDEACNARGTFGMSHIALH